MYWGSRVYRKGHEASAQLKDPSVKAVVNRPHREQDAANRDHSDGASLHNIHGSEHSVEVGLGLGFFFFCYSLSLSLSLTHTLTLKFFFFYNFFIVDTPTPRYVRYVFVFLNFLSLYINLCI